MPLFFSHQYLLSTYYVLTTDLGIGYSKRLKEIHFLSSWKLEVSSLDKSNSGSNSYDSSSF